MKTILAVFVLFVFVYHAQTDSVQRLFPKGVPAAIGPYTPVTKVGPYVYVSGQIAINPETGNIQKMDIEGQTRQVMDNLAAALAGANCTFSDVAKTTVYLSDMNYFSQFNTVYAQYFQKGKYPARVCFEVKGLPKPNALLQVDAIAYIPTKASNQQISQKKDQIQPNLRKD